jgi:putative SOS response-associated peptidase YedK
MCSRILQQGIDTKDLSQKYGIHFNNRQETKQKSNKPIGPGSPLFMVRLIDQSLCAENAILGFNTNWSSGIKLVFNARVEGANQNKANEIGYTGPLDIVNSPIFGEAIQLNRCIIPVNAFLESPDMVQSNKTFHIKQKSNQPFFLGGIYRQIVEGSTKTEICILTTGPNNFMHEIQKQRCPVLLDENSLSLWASTDTPIEEILNCCRSKEWPLDFIHEVQPHTIQLPF